MTRGTVVKSGRSRALGVRVLVVLGVTAATLVLAEILLRVLGVASIGLPVQFVGKETEATAVATDPQLFWRLKPRGGPDPVHEIGVRGAMFAASRGPRDLRVRCVGDSCAYGLNVRLHETWGMVLDRRLQDRFPDLNVETVLVAAPGYSTHQNLAFLRRHDEALAADVTILFVGSWNDFLLAAGMSDAGYAATTELLDDHPFWSLRLGRLAWRALHPLPSLEEANADHANAAAGEQKPLKRVSLADFRANVAALVERGRRDGVVVGIFPAARAGTKLPWAAEYRAALAETYRELGVPSINCDEAFGAFVASRPASWPAQEFLSDWVHPSASGHVAIAEALEPVVIDAAAARLQALAAGPPPAPVSVASVEPASLPPGRPAKLVIRGSGFGASRPRVFVDDQFVQTSRVVDDSTIDADVIADFLCKPGPARVSARTTSGRRAVPHAPVIRPWSVDVAVVERQGGPVIRVATETESSLVLHAWVSPELLDEGRKTRWGRFRLKDPTGEHPDAPFANPISLQGLKLPFTQAIRLEPGPSPLAGETPLPPAWAGRRPLFAQVMIRFGVTPEKAWLSDVIPVQVR